MNCRNDIDNSPGRAGRGVWCGGRLTRIILPPVLSGSQNIINAGDTLLFKGGQFLAGANYWFNKIIGVFLEEK